ncbi:g8443 [Coccomyxa viridis]|uniref:G8443 protein n=1 Tax=Coccomyxa viridis TaxID=1274662 RepID=A0ABP1G0D7_9CHLO
MRASHQRHVPAEGPSCSYHAKASQPLTARRTRTCRSQAAPFGRALSAGPESAKKVFGHRLATSHRLTAGPLRASSLHAAPHSHDPDDYELYEESFDDDEYQEDADIPAEDAEAAQERGRISGMLGPALAALQFAPVETAKAVHITVTGTASMVGRALSRTTQTISHATEEGVQEIARRTQTEKVVDTTRQRWKRATADLPKDPWGRIQWLWDRPPLKRLRLTISMAQWSVRLPAILALIATQIGLVASQFSLPMLAPLLFGTGILLRSIRTNASLIFPRIGVVVVLLWMLWFFNSVVQNTVVYLRRQGGLDHRVSGAIITASECTALLAAFVIVLSMLGVNVNALLLPVGIALAYAAKDLSHNFLAGFFLFAVQPFKLGDRVAVSYSTPASGGRAPWFEGICEKVDLRYTIVKNGPRRLFVPNSAFLTREFMVVDDPTNKSRRDLGANEAEYGIFGQPPPPDGSVWRSNAQYFNNGSRAPGGMPHQQQQEQMARQQYAPAKAATHSGQTASPAAQHSAAPEQAPDQFAAGQDGVGSSTRPEQAAEAPQQQTAKQPVGYPGSGQAVGLAHGVAGQPSYHAYQQGVSEDFWGYSSTGGPAYPGVYNPFP